MSRIAILGPVVLLWALPPSLAARTWIVDPGGAGDALTVQAGIDSSAVGDTVEVAPGTYFEHDVVLKSGIVLRSATGDPTTTILDAQHQGRVLFGHFLDETTEIEGFTITGGAGTWGSGMDCEQGAPTLRRCVFRENLRGPTVLLYEAAPTFLECDFRDNGDDYWLDTAMYFEYDSHAEFEGCTFVGNRSAVKVRDWSSAVFRQCTFAGNRDGMRLVRSDALFDHCIIAFTTVADDRYDFFRCWETFPEMVCTDVYGNQNGDWVGCLAGMGEVNGNFSADPLFCDAAGGDYTIRGDSPCAPPGPTGCGLVGSLDVGCGPVSVEMESWGRIKALYRGAGESR